MQAVYEPKSSEDVKLRNATLYLVYELVNEGKRDRDKDRAEDKVRDRVRETER